MSWLTSSWSDLGVTAGKAALMYATALVGLRLGERRALAQWTAIDFAAAVAIGAIVGRTAVASTQSYAIGAAALVSLLLLHRLTSLARFQPLLSRLTDHRVRVLVADGQLRRDQLRLCGLTDADILSKLRQHGIFDLHTVKYVLYEANGGLTIVPAHNTDIESGDVIDAGLQASAGFPSHRATRQR
jgi:uncharacterized membrane protein YcaP (DUF421 family)